MCNALFTNDSCFGKAKMILYIILSLIFPLLYHRDKTIVKNMLCYKHKQILLQFYPFPLYLLCQFCVNITNNTLGFHLFLFHLQNVITSIIILLAFGGGSAKAANFHKTVSCLFFPNFCSLFLLLLLLHYYYYYYIIIISSLYHYYIIFMMIIISSSSSYISL